MKRFIAQFLIFVALSLTPLHQSRAAVAFDAGTTDKITVSNALAPASGVSFTYLFWGKRTAAHATNTRGTTLSSGTSATDVFLYYFSLSAYGALMPRTTTSSEKQTTTELMPLNTQAFIAVTMSETNGIKIYYGDLSTAAREPSYSLDVAGSGTFTAGADATFFVNNRGSATTRSMPIEMSSVQLFNYEMTQAEIISQQFRPRVASGCVVWLVPFATGTIQNLCGDSTKNGIGTGLALASQHVPLGFLGM